MPSAFDAERVHHSSLAWFAAGCLAALVLVMLLTEGIHGTIEILVDTPIQNGLALILVCATCTLLTWGWKLLRSRFLPRFSPSARGRAVGGFAMIVVFLGGAIVLQNAAIYNPRNLTLTGRLVALGILLILGTASSVELERLLSRRKQATVHFGEQYVAIERRSGPAGCLLLPVHEKGSGPILFGPAIANSLTARGRWGKPRIRTNGGTAGLADGGEEGPPAARRMGARAAAGRPARRPRHGKRRTGERRAA
jgi:hypothetical protein